MAGHAVLDGAAHPADHGQQHGYAMMAVPGDLGEMPIIYSICLFTGGSENDLTLQEMATIMGYGIVMLGGCMLACVVPTRRALNIEPTIALRTAPRHVNAQLDELRPTW